MVPEAEATPVAASAPPRPVDDAYWVEPGRLLVGAHPGSRSRAQAMDRLRRFLEAGVTCFVDLTEPDESPAYEQLLPFETPTGRRVEYLREPIVDHGVPSSRETMVRILDMVDGALASGHVVYLHCRAGIGRSAMAAGCWLAERTGSGEQGLAALTRAWPQAVQSHRWPTVPETDEQARYVLAWNPVRVGASAAASRARPDGTRDAAPALAARLQGAWLGLALGDALGTEGARKRGGKPAVLEWTQHTALALCTLESLLAAGRFDARDLIDRFVRWQREGYCSSSGAPPGPGGASADVAKSLATYLWRGLPAAGSHDPADLSPNSLPRVLAAAAFAAADPPGALTLAAECSRATHQSPAILDACRLYGAMLVAGLRGQPAAEWLAGLPQTTPACWDARPLHKDVLALTTMPEAGAATTSRPGTVLHALSEVRRLALAGDTFESGCDAARRSGKGDGALYCALYGTVYGVLHGVDALPAPARERLVGSGRIEDAARRCVAHARAAGVSG
jgi:ADP-ribosylglycohydrolase